MWHTGSIDVLSHPDIVSQNWEVLQDVIINCMCDSLYWLSSDVLELPCLIIPLYISGSVLFLLFLHLCYGGALIIYHDVRIFIF